MNPRRTGLRAASVEGCMHAAPVMHLPYEQIVDTESITLHRRPPWNTPKPDRATADEG